MLAEAEAQQPQAFASNAWAVGALQAAWSAIHHTPVPDDGPACLHLQHALTAAIRIGHDTDTVAAIAGALRDRDCPRAGAGDGRQPRSHG